MTIDEEIMLAVEKGESENFIRNSVGFGKNFRGYVITHKATGIKVADYIFSYNQSKYELRKRPGFQREIDSMQELLPKEDANAILYSDYELCLQYVEYVRHYIDNLINHRGMDMQMQIELKKKRDALEDIFKNQIMLAVHDVEDYSQMGGFEEQVKTAKATVKQRVYEFESMFLKLFPEGLSFNNSPVYLDSQRKPGM